MTTVIETRDTTTLSVVYTTDGTALSGIHSGTVDVRSSSGADRPSGTRAGMIPVLSWVRSKPYIWRNIVIRPAEVKLVRNWKPDPFYPGFEIPHNYTATFVNVRCGKALATRNPFGNWTNEGNAYNLIGNLPLVVDPFTAEDHVACVGQLRTHIAGSNFNAGVFLGEAPKSLKMIADATSQIYRAYKNVRKGNPIAAVDALFGAGRSVIAKVRNGRLIKNRLINGRAVAYYSVKPPRGPKFLVQESKEAAASNWLALQYGWKPLLGDIHDAAVFVDHQLRNPLHYRYTALRYANGKRFGSTVDVPLTSGRAAIRHRITSSERIVAYLKEIYVPRLTGVMNPETVLWELVPFSFVVDWFLPIGNYLENRALNQSLSGTYVITKKLRVSAFGGEVVTSRIVDTTCNYVGGNTSNCVKIIRTVTNDISTPLPSVVPIGKALSWTRAANAVALMVGLKSSRI